MTSFANNDRTTEALFAYVNAVELSSRKAYYLTFIPYFKTLESDAQSAFLSTVINSVAQELLVKEAATFGGFPTEESVEVETEVVSVPGTDQEDEEEEEEDDYYDEEEEELPWEVDEDSFFYILSGIDDGHTMRAYQRRCSDDPTEIAANDIMYALAVKWLPRSLLTKEVNSRLKDSGIKVGKAFSYFTVKVEDLGPWDGVARISKAGNVEVSEEVAYAIYDSLCALAQRYLRGELSVTTSDFSTM